MNNYSDNNIKIFVISLIGSERRSHIIKEFQKFNIEFEFIDAVNGKLLKLDSDPLIDYSAVLKHPKWLTPGMVGCSLSHIKCYQKIIDENLDFALILEDDVCLNFDIADIAKNITKFMSPDEVTLFFYQCWEEIFLSKKDAIPISLNTSFFRTSGKLKLISTGGYMIGNSACKKMIENLLPVHIAPDPWKYFCERGIISKVNILYPLPISNAYFESTLGYQKNKIVSIITKVINKYQLPFLYQYIVNRRKKFHKKTTRIIVT